jgi:hypothetical protein
VDLCLTFILSYVPSLYLLISFNHFFFSCLHLRNWKLESNMIPLNFSHKKFNPKTSGKIQFEI